MGWFSAPSKAELQGHRTVRINGHRFIIRKVNPILDFPESGMPQVFTDFQSRRGLQRGGQANARKVLDDMRAVLAAGVVEPKLVPVGVGGAKGDEPGLTAEDLMRDEDTAIKLYWEVLVHSLNMFKGLKGVFFSAAIRRSLSTTSPSGTGGSPATSPSAGVPA